MTQEQSERDKRKLAQILEHYEWKIECYEDEKNYLDKDDESYVPGMMPPKHLIKCAIIQTRDLCINLRHAIEEGMSVEYVHRCFVEYLVKEVKGFRKNQPNDNAAYRLSIVADAASHCGYKRTEQSK